MHKKHFLFILPALLLLGGCEAGDKIVAFWTAQAAKLMSTPYGMTVAMGLAQRQAQTREKMKSLNISAEEKSFSEEDFDRRLANARAELKRLETELNAALPASAGVPEATPAAASNTQPPKPRTPRAPKQIMEISIEDDAPNFKGRAPVEDQRSMHRSIDFIKSTNQQAVTDVQRLMGNAARDEVILLNTNTEKRLYNASVRAASLQQFNQMQKSILAQYKADFQKILNKYQKNIKRS